MDKLFFEEVCVKITNQCREKNGIGTLGEKTLHAVLKQYFEPFKDSHEIKIGSFVADIVGENGIIEIQTQSFDKLRKKLENFLAVATVTVVYPIASTKWLVWVDEHKRETAKKRKSPKKGSVYEMFYELYKIKHLLTNPNLRLCIVMLDIVEYRSLNGWSKDKKKGSSRYDRIPTNIIDEIYLENTCDYAKLIPETLPKLFTTTDYKKAAGINQSNSQIALNVLYSVGAVKRVGKTGNKHIYEKTIF